MVGSVFVDKKVGDITKGRKVCGEVSGICFHTCRRGREFPMLVGGIIDGKGKFTTDGNEAA